MSENRNSIKLLQNKAGNLAGKASNLANKGRELGKQASNAVKSRISNVSEKVKNVQLPSAGLNLAARASQFAESNTAISKFIFILFMLFVFLFLFNIGVMGLQSLLGYKKNPILLDGMTVAKKTTIINVNPNDPGSVPIYRSVNEDQGAEFTWNVWFFIDGLNPNNPTYSRIFSKGSENNALGLKSLCTPDHPSCKNIFNSSPGLFVSKNKSSISALPFPTENSSNHVNLVLMLNTFIKPKSGGSKTTFAESVTIENVPMKKWVCATIRVQQTTVDIYINGNMTQRKKLSNLPVQNYYDVKVGDTDDGFDGAISSLRYYNKALSYDEVQSLFGKGPNLKSLDNHGLAGKDYLSTNWYYKSK